MKHFRVVLWTVLTGAFLFAQLPSPPTPADPEKVPEVRLPNGKLQKDEILKAEHAKNLEDARQLSRLADELEVELKKNTQYVFSLSTIKKTEEIEKIAKRIRSRMKRN